MEGLAVKLLAIALMLLSVSALADQVVDYGYYTLKGTLRNGDRDNPGVISNPTLGNTYAGLALDEPVIFTKITSGMDTSLYQALSHGKLFHIQMLMNAKQAATYKNLYGKHVSVSCQIDFVGRLYTPVFCQVQRITEEN